jgi:hypothetical protein
MLASDNTNSPTHHSRIPEICTSCHGNAEVMAKYNFARDDMVVTYDRSVHGLALATNGIKTAVCTDCHGVHDIQKASDPQSAVMSANLQKTCAKCHQGASATFPKAWLSHYEPSLQKAPLVWLVQLFYRLMIPFMVGGLVLQIALHLWRVVVNR